MAADLLRTPPLRQQLDDHLLQNGVGVETSPVVADPSRRRLTVGIEGKVAAPLSGVAAQLAGDRRRGSPELVRDLSNTPTCVAQIGDVDPLGLGQEPRTDLTHGKPFEGRHEPDQPAASVDLVATRPVVSCGPRDADLKSCATDAPSPLTQPLNCSRLADSGRRPGPFFTRQDDNTAPRI